VARKASSVGTPVIPITRPASARNDGRGRSEMIESSGCGTIEATAMTGSFFSAAKKSSGSYETARSMRPAASSFNGVVGSAGTRIRTLRPAASK
jgi:hypothetical protein